MASFTIIFDVDKNSPTYGKWLFTDTTDYSALGWNINDVVGWFIITFPNGNGYSGSQSVPDISVGNGTNNTISIPQDANGNWLTGNYTFVFNIYNSVTLQTLSATTTYKYCPPFKFTDIDEGTISNTTDCFQYKLNVLDKTNYGTPTTKTELITLYPPQPLIDSGDAPIVTSASSSLLYVFGYTGTYVATIDTALTYVSGTVTVQGRVTADKEIPVQCSINICSLIACYNEKLRKLTYQISKTGYLESVDNALKTDMLLASFYLLGFKENSACGNYTKATEDYNKLAKVLNCDCGCGDNLNVSDDIRLVNPNFNPTISQTYNVIGQGSIQVTSNTVGSTTTFTVSLSPTLINTINGNTANITALQGNVTTLQGNVSTLQGQVSALQANKYDQVVASFYNVSCSGILAQRAAYTAAVGELANGDELELIAEFTRVAGAAEAILDLRIAGTTVSFPFLLSYSLQGQSLFTRLFIKKQNDTTIRYTVEISWALPKITSRGANEVQVDRKLTDVITVPDLSANTLTIECRAGDTNAPSNFTMNYATVKKYTV